MALELTKAVFEAPLGSIGARAERERQYSEFIKESVRDMGVMVAVLEKTKQYLLYFKVPFSDNHLYTRKGFYDVVFLMSPPRNQSEGLIRFAQFNSALPRVERKPSDDPRELNGYSFQVFSNSMGFMYTYTFVYNHNKLLIPWIPNSKYELLALTKPPLIRNPRMLIYYEKSLWHPYFFMKKFHLFNSEVLRNMHDDKLNKEYVLTRIMNQREKEDEYKKMKDLYRDTQRNADRKEKEAKRFIELAKSYSKRNLIHVGMKPNSNRIDKFDGRFVEIGNTNPLLLEMQE